jgi:hypothetical protein
LQLKPINQHHPQFLYTHLKRVEMVADSVPRVNSPPQSRDEDDSNLNLPPYQATEARGNVRRSSRKNHAPSDEHSSRDDNANENLHGSGGQGSYIAPRQTPDSRSAYAMQVQRACSNALRLVKQDNDLATSAWAEPLTAAPTAISVMAFLLKTAANRKVAGLTISSQSVKDEKQKEEVGVLPYVSFNTIHCQSDPLLIKIWWRLQIQVFPYQSPALQRHWQNGVPRRTAADE